MIAVGLVVKMLRYRIASLLLPFLLLGPAFHERLLSFHWQQAAALIALCASYVVATSLNDVFDLEVDRVNHAGSRARPLVSGEATARHLLLLAAIAALVSLVAAAVVGPAAGALAFSSLLLNVAYSVPPLRLCARSLAAPVLLALAYVALPYGLGLASIAAAPDTVDARVIASFAVLFLARMLLKDFRDLRGDTAFGKRTFLVVHGKQATLAFALTCIVVGNALLLTVIPAVPLLAACVEAYFGGVLIQLYRLWRAGDAQAEQLAIATGARMGNAVVLTLLGALLLMAAGAPPGQQAAFVVTLAVLFWAVYVYATARPEQALAAYRG